MLSNAMRNPAPAYPVLSRISTANLVICSVSMRLGGVCPRPERDDVKAPTSLANQIPLSKPRLPPHLSPLHRA